MMAITPIDRIPAIRRDEVEALAATEYGRVADQLRALTPEDWARPTDCDLWDVRAMAGHTAGMMSDFTGFRPLMRRMRAASSSAKHGEGPLVDHMTAGQVAETASLSTDELIARIEVMGPKAARWRAKAPALFRKMPMKEEVGGQAETWRMGYLLGTILTRDPWMHRVDIARATGHAMVLTPEHDGRLVADVVAEWARRHGQPFRLTLTGAAGGEFVSGDGGEGGVVLELDAVEFCRMLSGRAEGVGLLSHEVPF